jgi:DNA helicase HerA-like ATPase
MALFEYQDSDSLGRVSSVDSATVLIEVADTEQLKRLQVNRLAVLQSSKPGQHLIGSITQVTRKKVHLSGDIGNDDFQEHNLCKIYLIGTFLDRDGDKSDVFRRTLGSVPEIDANCFALEGEHLTQFMRILSNTTAEGTSLTLGRYSLDENAVAYLNGNKLFQRHAFIGGSTGSGKSWTTATIIEQIANLSHASSIVFDIHGEYAPLNGENISHLKIAGATDIEESRSIEDGIIHLPYWLLTYEALVSLFVDRSDQNAPNQSMIIAREINEEKRKYLSNGGHSDVMSSFTIDSPVPFEVQSLLDRLNQINSEMVEGANNRPKQGEFYGKLSRMISRLEHKRTDRRLGFLFAADDVSQNFEWLEQLSSTLLGSRNENEIGGVKIVDFSEVPSDILPLIVSMVARLAFSVQQWTAAAERHPIALLCDEAHLYIPQRNNSDSSDMISIDIFERIAKEGRKYGVGLVIVSQRPSEVNKTVISQCSNFIAMRLTNSEDQSVVRKLLPESLGGFSDTLPTLDSGEALVVGDASLLPTRIRVDEPTNKPNSGTVEFWDEWQKAASAGRLESAVGNWRKQNIS